MTMRPMIAGLVLFAALLSGPGRAAEPLLKPGGRLVFLGDSYVGDRGASALVMDALALHHPGAAISVRTAFIRDVNFAATGLLPFFPATVDTDVLSVKPTVVLLAFGLERANAKPRDLAFLRRFFVAPLAAMVEKLRVAGAKVILVTPGCIDPDKQPALKGGGEYNVAQTAQAIRDLAAQVHVPLVDVHALMLRSQSQGKAANPAFSLVKEGITLTAAGESRLAGAYLRGLGEDGKASGLTIDAAAGTAQADRSTIANLALAADRITFSRTDESLPAYFPADAACAIAPDSSPASQEQYPLRITGLVAGRWKVSAESIEVGVFPAEALAAGVNLARRPGPWRELGARMHAMARQQETLYTDRCTAVGRLNTPPEAEPERLTLLGKCDAYVEAFEKQRLAVVLAGRTWTWKIQRLP